MIRGNKLNCVSIFTQKKKKKILFLYTTLLLLLLLTQQKYEKVQKYEKISCDEERITILTKLGKEKCCSPLVSRELSTLLLRNVCIGVESKRVGQPLPRDLWLATRRGEGKYYSNSACTPAIRPSFPVNLLGRPTKRTEGRGGGCPLLAPNLELSVCHPFCLEEGGGASSVEQCRGSGGRENNSFTATTST